MRRVPAIAAVAWALLAAPAFAASPTPSPTPAGLPIKGVTVEVQPVELAPGMPAGAPPAGSHVEQPPGPMKGFATPRKPKPSATPARKP